MTALVAYQIDDKPQQTITIDCGKVPIMVGVSVFFRFVTNVFLLSPLLLQFLRERASEFNPGPDNLVTNLI